MVLIPSRLLLGTACLFLPLLAQASSAPVASQATTMDIVCAPDNATDCYPKIFEPTKDFQVIKEGQEIPPGLHVRMNFATGVKEARLNIPIEGEESVEQQLEGLPTEQAIVVVEQPEAETELEPEQPAMRDQVPMKAPSYDTAGKVMPPIRDPESKDEMTVFQKSMLTIKMEARAFDQALDDLMDLSHDIYYGVEIAKDGPALEKLLCLTLGASTQRMNATENDRSHKAASILGSAIQNNPTALKEIEKFEKMVLYPTCAESDKSASDFVGILNSHIASEDSPAALKSRVGAISGLLREPKFREEFLRKEGMEPLLSIFLKEGEQFDIVRKKVAQLIMDNFLDEEMGASLGSWPTKGNTLEKVCKISDYQSKDGCWEHHIEAFLETSPKATWAKELLTSLQRQRAKLQKVSSEREL